MGFQALAIDTLPALGIHVVNIVGLRPQEQVPFGVGVGRFGLTTRRVVAVMQDVYPFGNWPVGQPPREAMGKNHLPVDLDPTVTVPGGPSPGPLSTTVRHPDQSPLKPPCNIHTHIITACGGRTKRGDVKS